MGARGKSTAVRLAQLPVCLMVAALWCCPLAEAVAQKPQSQGTTFQFKEAKNPSESADSIKLLERALELTQTALGPDDRAVGELAYRLAQRYDDAGEYDKALRMYERSLAIKEKELGLEDSGVGDCLNDLGCLQQEMENYEEALKLFQRSLVITEKVYGPEHAEVATTWSNIADTDYLMADYAGALRAGKRALQIREKLLGVKHPDVADSLRGSADANRALGNLSEALRLAERALKIAEKGLRADHPVTAECLFTLAEIQKYRGNLDQAIALHERALAINEKISGPEHPDVFRSLTSLGQVWALKGDVNRSMSVFIDLSARQRHYLARHFQTSSWRVASRVADMFRTSSEMLQNLCGVSRADPAAAALAGAGNSALNKAFWEEVQSAHAALEATQQESVNDLQAQYRSLQSQLVHLPDVEDDDSRRDAKRLSLEADLNRILTELAQRVGLVAKTLLDQRIELPTVAAALPSRARLVDFVEYRRYDFSAKTNEWKEHRYTAFVTAPFVDGATNLAVFRVDLGEAAPIDQAVETLCKRMSAGQYDAGDFRPSLHRLSDLVYAPLARYLTNAAHLIICSDGQLGRVPFEMLPVSSSATAADGDRFLLEEKTITYAGSGRELVQLAGGKGNRPNQLANQSNQPEHATLADSRGNAVVIGAPDFELDLREAHAAEGGGAGATNHPESPNGYYRDLTFRSLPEAEAEARIIAGLLGENTILKVGKEARETALKTLASPRVLHVATHGFFLSDQEFRQINALTRNSLLLRRITKQRQPGQDFDNPLARCGIALAGANHALQVTNILEEDGLLTGLEASQLKLQGTELVILSACETGSGEVRIGEGLMSLRRAFRIAGAETVLASHWQVSDRATEKLMTTFIKGWKSGKSRAVAWREAQLSLLNSKECSNPYFWAAFTLTGQWN